MLKEFREFALRGNVVDLAVGVIIGVAFGAIVTSLVQDIFSPVIGLITGGTDFSGLYIQLSGDAGPGATLEQAQAVGATLAYGRFLTALINFLIVAFVLFLVIKAMNRMKRKAPPPPVVEVTPTKEEVLLGEIRDAIRQRPIG
ncbi:MAG: large conductance mechanosensitive channel protein MscL [Bauldia sp.]|nr:large conductance mechanosensitive channel protein MscL [Bauldia sp.]